MYFIVIKFNPNVFIYQYIGLDDFIKLYRNWYGHTISTALFGSGEGKRNKNNLKKLYKL